MRSKGQTKKSKSVGQVNPFDKLLIDKKEGTRQNISQYKQKIVDTYLNGVTYFDEVFYNDIK